MRRIAVISGKRGGFGAMIPLLQLIDNSPQTELILIVTDQHLYRSFGYTVTEVEKWFEVSYQVNLQQQDDKPLSRAQAIGVGVQEIAKVFAEAKPDLLLVLGDRGEVLAAVIAAINLGIPVAHIQGGDISGSIDEFFRHAITKMSHLHFPSTVNSAERIKKMGEAAERIFVVGDCHLDLISEKKFTPREEVLKKYNLDGNKPIILVLQHPVTTEPELSYPHMKEICAALREYKFQTILVYPCSDQGYDGILRAIEEMREESYVQIHKNIEAPDFWGLQSLASVLLGNSSAGLIETPCFGIPSITVGKRQTGRERAENCLSVEPVREDLIRTLNFAIDDEHFRKICRSCVSPYGKGGSYLKIYDVITTVDLDRNLFEKRMTY